MPAELILTFPDHEHVLVSLREDHDIVGSPAQPFVSPLEAETRAELTWYLEIYAARYTTEQDDPRASRTAARLKGWGAALLDAVLTDHAARRLFNRFQDNAEPGRLISINSIHPAILAQPWELLCDSNGTFLFLETPSISIRRRLTGHGRAPYRPEPKDSLHLLFVVSRPNDAGLIDPRADPLAVLDALDAEAPGRVTVEFLRPPTLSALHARLNDGRKPPVDILHFDGHGTFDPDGRTAEPSRNALSTTSVASLVRDTSAWDPEAYLLFESDDYKSDRISASKLGDVLQSKRIGLVILSACQSATVGSEDIFASVAPRLIRAGIPSVLAMTHSVLVATTRMLGGHFYRELAAGQPIGKALDTARSQLFINLKRGERQRAAGPVDLLLQDWFVPVMYQSGADRALLTRAISQPEAPAVSCHNLPDAQESGFYGRARELRDIERWFAAAETRRIVVKGFGGQGKTALAQEAGRWLLRTGLFDRVCFVSYANFQGADPVQMTVSALAVVLAATLIDADAATVALRSTRTLLILDNFESLDQPPRTELLSTAAAWSEQGGSRVLLTTRQDVFSHLAFPAAGSFSCRHLVLDGLAPQDALDWFQRLLRLPPEPVVQLPKRAELEELFGQVSFHPLSIRVLMPLLKRQRFGDIADALRTQLGRDGDALIASLNLSLQRLDTEAQAIVPRLGVFINGAWEPNLMEVLQLDPVYWGRLREELRQAGLVYLEAIPGTVEFFIRFHPTLAPTMYMRLSAGDREALGLRYREAYYRFSGELFRHASQDAPAARQRAQREFPNLLTAVASAVDTGGSDSAFFINNVAFFLRAFSRNRDLATLIAKGDAAGFEAGSEAWFVIQENKADFLLQCHCPKDATVVLQGILKALDNIHKHLDEAVTCRRGRALSNLARCAYQQSEFKKAEDTLRAALEIVRSVPASRQVLQLESFLLTDLVNVLTSLNQLDAAEKEHKAAIAIKAQIEDERAVAVSQMQLGLIYLLRHEFPRAAQIYSDLTVIFRRLNEPVRVAACYHQLGSALGGDNLLLKAEEAYREALRLKEAFSDQYDIATTCLIPTPGSVDSLVFSQTGLNLYP